MGDGRGGITARRKSDAKGRPRRVARSCLGAVATGVHHRRRSRRKSDANSLMTVSADDHAQIGVEKQFVVGRCIAGIEGMASMRIRHKRECGEMMGHKNQVVVRIGGEGRLKLGLV